MTKLLEKALDSIRDLPPSEQDALAQIMLDELESERLWDERFAKGNERLKVLADKAWAEHQAGESEPLNPDKMKEQQWVLSSVSFRLPSIGLSRYLWRSFLASPRLE
jgi:hypothetical protein